MTTLTETIRIEGMSCGHCVAAVRRALGDLAGVDVCDVALGSATISYDPESTTRATIADAVEEAGFTMSERSEV